ncbi:MAG: diaminopimelate epimerase [Akkermansiaceae bacterium]|nr:diaminopimelate epimerase [Akkermansiaceae bacterium]
MTLKFWKMNGAGNDFVVLDNRDGSRGLDGAQIAQLCHRQRGVGADGLLAVEPAQNGADFRMRYYNADGGEAEMCGNGARCFARFANFLSDNRLERVSFETIAGTIGADFIGDQVRIALSAPHGLALELPLEVDGEALTVHSLNTGVPHAVFFVDDLEGTDVRRLGRATRFHAQFAPAGTNVNFVKIEAPGEIAIRTYERGVEDETLACGTGMAACALIHHLLHGAGSPIRVRVRGGDVLEVAFETGPGENAGDFQRVTLTGPADFTFHGEVEI